MTEMTTAAPIAYRNCWTAAHLIGALTGIGLIVFGCAL